MIGDAVLAEAMDSLMIVMWVSVALSAIVGVPFTLWYWKRIDKGARPHERRFKEKGDDRQRVTIDIDQSAVADDSSANGTN